MRWLLIATVLLGCGGEPKPVPVLANAAPPDAAVRDATPIDAPTISMTEDDARAGAEAFQNVVSNSSQDLLRCFNQSGAQQATKIMIIAVFSHGKTTSVTFAPSLGEPFEGCAEAIGRAWTLPMAADVTYRVTLSLSP